ncbi:MAG: adenylate/guanylate cyclase domain-containing response regulator [bacterium]|nr:adenylate/guanylate cyclase domain-containing response regulator [bacterium]
MEVRQEDPGTKKGTTVLVADDEEMMRDILSGVLKRSSYRVLVAVDGQDALEKAELDIPDLIISDVHMPRLSGWQLLEKVKASEALKHIPFILITGKDSQEMRLGSLGAGADDYLSKPFNYKELVIRAHNLIKLHRQEKELIRLNRELEQKVSRQLDIIVKNKRLTRFFPRKLVKWILSSEKDLELTGENKILTIFFSDLSGFSELSEKHPPEVMRNVLNDYFTEMVNLVEQYEGTLDKFIGDGLMVFFGAPDPMEEKEQAERAVSMAVSMQKQMKELTGKWTEQGISHQIKIRMGIHQDLVMVGNFGSRQLMEYTVIGSGVNLANRLESYCTPDKILVSAKIQALTKDLFSYQKVVMQRIRGFERMVPVSELDPDM